MMGYQIAGAATVALNDGLETQRKTNMTLFSKPLHAVALALGILLLAPLAGPASSFVGVTQANAQTINRINVDGNVRVDDATVISYLTVRVGERVNSSKIESSVASLLSTGLFETVNASMSGNTLRVRVSENGIVGSVLFEGNKRFSDDQLLAMVDSGARGVFTPQRLSTDEQTIRLAYSRAGFEDVSVSSRTETDGNNRTRVIFVVNEGERASISTISFSGNNTFDANQLKSVIGTKESHILSWLFQDDMFDEDRLSVDGEIIRNFYANHGYPDAQILSAVSEFDADKNAHFVSFTISEGEKYTFGDIGIETSIFDLNVDGMKGDIRTEKGQTYSLAKLQRSAEDLAISATDQGFAFADVRPRVERNIVDRTFNVTYLVDEGARVYVERINIRGNDKTRDFVVRRELDFAEGDPFNRTLISRGKANIEALGLFSAVQVNTAPGSAADKVVINIALVESSSGDYGITAGYDTAAGILGEISLTERNFLGRGQYLKASIGASTSGQSYQLSFTEPRFMGLKISSGFDLYSRVTDENSKNFYGRTATGGQLRIGVPITRDLSSTFFVGLENKSFRDTNNDSVVAVNGAERLAGTVGYTLTYNGVDNTQNPTEGLYATFTQKYVGIEDNYLQTELKARYFVPLLEDNRIIASLKGQVGVVTDFSGNGVAASESFFPGSRLVRGFQSSGLGARAASGEALGATFYAGLSAEVEFPIPSLPESWGLTGAVWADTGFIGSPSSTVSAFTATGMANEWRSSVGISVLWDSPFGPLRGDFAHVIQQDTGDKTQMFALTLKTLL